MADTDRTQSTFEPGTVDQHSHGWAPDTPGTGEAKSRAVEGNLKAFEGNETQQGSRGPGLQGPDLAPDNVGESVGRRGEDVIKDDGPEPGREDLGTQGPSGRPVGTATARSSAGVDPDEPIDDDMPNAQTGDQAG